jgi:sugar/nucleoside kinase (ribokinase family)
MSDIRAVDTLILNRDEGRCLTGASDDAAIVVALAARHAAGALTLGADGALTWRGTERCAAQPPTRLDVDPTGAGDVFAAAFVVRLLAGGGLEAASQEACARAHAHLAARQARSLGA